VLYLLLLKKRQQRLPNTKKIKIYLFFFLVVSTTVVWWWCAFYNFFSLITFSLLIFKAKLCKYSDSKKKNLFAVTIDLTRLSWKVLLKESFIFSQFNVRGRAQAIYYVYISPFLIVHIFLNLSCQAKVYVCKLERAYTFLSNFYSFHNSNPNNKNIVCNINAYFCYFISLFSLSLRIHSIRVPDFCVAQ
jgi:hypothetical protein